MSSRIQFFKQRVLPSALKNEPVVQELTRAIGTSVLQAHQNAVQAANYNYSVGTADFQIDQTAGAEPGALDMDSFGPPRDLSYSDFASFASTLRQVLLETPVSNPSPEPIELYGVAVSTPDVVIAQSAFNQALVYYFNQYYKNAYIDRFGTPVLGPNSLQTISDNEIAGTVTVFLELIMDYAFQTPIWIDSTNKIYLPGSGTVAKPPTAVGGKLVPIAPLLASATDAETETCGITVLKAQAIQYVAQTAGSRASALGGTVGGSFGGISVGLGVLGKFSLGDNKTLQTLAKTALQVTVARAGEEASYRTLYWIGYKQSEVATLLQMIQKYLTAQLSGSTKS
jgi:hypothetical protein